MKIETFEDLKTYIDNEMDNFTATCRDGKWKEHYTPRQMNVERGRILGLLYVKKIISNKETDHERY